MRSRNVILIHIDTLRYDHLGCYGYKRATSPNIDRIAEEGVLFTRAYSTDVPTIPYYTSMFTGMRGTSTGVVWEEDLPPDIPFFTRALAAKGIKTAAVSTLSLWKPWFTRDFHIFMNPVAGQPRRIQQVDAEEINRFAIHFIKNNRKEPFFLWLHYWDPHTFYWPPEPYRSLFQEDKWIPPNFIEMDWSQTQHLSPEIKRLWIEKCRYGFIYLGASNPPEIEEFWKERTSERRIAYELLVNLYDGEISYVDKCIGELMLTLEEEDLEERTMIIITSDHGESHGEHDDIFNHVDVYEPTVHVPLIIKASSDLPSGKVIDDLVQNIDLAPFIFDYFGIKKPPSLEGISLYPRLTGESSDPVRKVVFSDTGLAQCARMICNGKWKMIETIHGGIWEKPANPELYNLEKDPLEMKNLSVTEKDRVDELQLMLHRSLMKRLDQKPDPLRLVAKKRPPQYLEVLRLLGITERKLKRYTLKAKGDTFQIQG